MKEMSWKRKALNGALDIADSISIRLARHTEIKKYDDVRRKNIYLTVDLSQEQIKDVNELFLNNYGETVPLTWHRHFTAFTGKFDKYYFPELLFIPEFERFMNSEQYYTSTFSDKNILPMLSKASNVAMPYCYFSSVNGLIQNESGKIASINDIKQLNGEFFIKPTTNTSSGSGCQALLLDNGIDKRSEQPIDRILLNKGNNWVLQERLHCHKSIEKIYPDSVNTFRIMTYIWSNDIKHCPVIMRIGRGGNYLDNAHAGGMFIALEDDGTMHSTAFTEFNDQFTKHPDTNLIFENYKINHLKNTIQAAKECHSHIPQIGCINWDFTINEDGKPVLIEANVRGGSIWLFQMAHGKGAFGELTPEILQWLKFMKHMNKSKRVFYSYGNTKNRYN